MRVMFAAARNESGAAKMVPMEVDSRAMKIVTMISLVTSIAVSGPPSAANSVVPKITLILGGSYGAGHYALCGKAYDPRFIFAWPTARYAVMAGASAARTLADLRVRQEESRGRKLSNEEKRSILNGVEAQYNRALDPRYAAARLWVDKIIPPGETRKALILALDVAALNPHVEPFRTGVLQV